MEYKESLLNELNNVYTGRNINIVYENWNNSELYDDEVISWNVVE